MEQLHLLEGIGLSFAAYGIVAGAIRGFTSQFTRFSVWLLAITATSLLGVFIKTISSNLTKDLKQAIRLEIWIEIGTLLLFVFLLGALRRLFLGGIKNGGRIGERLLGIITGFASSTLMWLIVIGGSENVKPGIINEGKYTLEVAGKLTRPFTLLPEDIQLKIFDTKKLKEQKKS